MAAKAGDTALKAISNITPIELAITALNNWTNWSALIKEKEPAKKSNPPHPALKLGGEKDDILSLKTLVLIVVLPPDKTFLVPVEKALAPVELDILPFKDWLIAFSSQFFAKQIFGEETASIALNVPIVVINFAEWITVLTALEVFEIWVLKNIFNNLLVRNL